MEAVHKESGTRVAIKVIKDLFEDLYSSKILVSELQILRKLTQSEGNRHTTKIYDIIPAANFEQSLDDEAPVSHIFVVMECAMSDLQCFLKEESSNKLSQQ